MLLQILEEARSSEEKPSIEDLEAAFTLADEDQSGAVDHKEFIELMKLINAGKVTGLGRPGWFKKVTLEQMCKKRSSSR